MDQDWVLYEKDGVVARIILNRPERHNSLPHDAQLMIADHIHRAEEDDEVKVIVIKGNGPSFCSGMDVASVGTMHDMATPQSGERASRPPARNVIMNDHRLNRNGEAALYSIKTTIAQVHGYCLGAALSLVLNCDYAIAAENAIFSVQESRFGASGALPDIFPMILACGPKKARELVQLGRRFDGLEAVRLNLVNRAVPLAELEQTTNDFATAVSALPRDGLALGKAYFHTILDLLGWHTAKRAYVAAHGQVLGIRWGEDEFNFLKARRDLGGKGAIDALNDRFPESLR